MSILAGFWHVVNFLWAGFGLALVLWLALRLRVRLPRPWRALAWLVATGWAVSLLGLVWGGQDGLIATYTALVVAQGTLAWRLAKRGR